jgi:predicted deacylase
MERYGVDYSGSGYGLVVGSSGHGNELSGSIRRWKILEDLSYCCLVKKD